jgi:tRNA nucleotidyltransferase (CCA-adding enzyme)
VKFAPVLVYSRGRRLIPISISDKFATLIQRIAPTPAENSAFSSHLKTVSAAAEAVLEINRTERIGSFSRGTAVRGISDLDLMVVLSSNERKWGRATRRLCAHAA